MTVNVFSRIYWQNFPLKEMISDTGLLVSVMLSVSSRSRFFVSITDILLTAVLLLILFRTCAVI